LQQADRNRSPEEWAKSLILYHVSQGAVVRKSRAAVRASGGETGM